MSEYISYRERESAVTLFSDGADSSMWYVVKEQPKYLTDNEWHALVSLSGTGFVPSAERLSIEKIRLEYLIDQPVTDSKKFMSYFAPVMEAMERAGVRHGDLTEPHIFVVRNRPVIIDWGESRAMCDPRPDKRREGDSYWLKTSMEKICQRC